MTILIIEDNKGDFFLIEEYLQEEFKSIKIDHISTFQDAKEQLSEPNQYNAILLDLTLPDCKGEKLVTHIVNYAGSVPVIVLTGYSDKEFSVKALSMGISDYLLKDGLTGAQLFKSINYSIERRKFNRQLSESEEKYRNLFNFNPLPMWVYERETLEFLSVNDAAIRHYGYSREEFMTMTLRDIRPAEDIPLLEKVINDSKTEINSGFGIFRHRKKNGVVFDVEIQGNNITYEGKPGRMILATDITDRMEYIRAIEKQNHAMREIAWIQSHVVRAPLARILGLADLLVKDKIQRDQSKVINYIIDSSKELDNIVRDIVRKTEKVEKKI